MRPRARTIYAAEIIYNSLLLSNVVCFIPTSFYAEGLSPYPDNI